MADKTNEAYERAKLICPNKICDERGCYTSCYLSSGKHRHQACEVRIAFQLNMEEKHGNKKG